MLLNYIYDLPDTSLHDLSTNIQTTKNEEQKQHFRPSNIVLISEQQQQNTTSQELTADVDILQSAEALTFSSLPNNETNSQSQKLLGTSEFVDDELLNLDLAFLIVNDDRDEQAENNDNNEHNRVQSTAEQLIPKPVHLNQNNYSQQAILMQTDEISPATTTTTTKVDELVAFTAASDYLDLEPIQLELNFNSNETYF